MPTLYVASTETFVGKSATCIGLLDRAQRDGRSIAYMKPVSVSSAQRDESLLDEDCTFIRKHFGLSEPVEQLAPVHVTQSAVEQILRGRGPDFARRLRDSYVRVSRDKDFVVLEGANHWAEGSLVGLSADQVSDELAAPVLLVTRYRTTLAVDAILAVQRYLGDRLLGVLLNQVEESQLEFVKSRVVPFLEQQGVPVYATLVHEPALAGITVADLIDQLGGQYIGSADLQERIVEHLAIGAMGPENAMSHLRRHPNKAVITGGDRTDLQLAALETSTAVLVLTGNIRPAPQVLDRAEECGVPVILLPDDTLTAIGRAESVFGRIRFKQSAKVQRYITLLDTHFDFERLYESLGMN